MPLARRHWVVDNGSSHRGKAAAERLRRRWPSAGSSVFPPTPAGSTRSRSTSIVQRKVLTPNDFADLAEVESRLLAFERRYEQTADPFEWKFTRDDLTKLMRRLADKPDYQAAA